MDDDDGWCVIGRMWLKRIKRRGPYRPTYRLSGAIGGKGGLLLVVEGDEG